MCFYPFLSLLPLFFAAPPAFAGNPAAEPETSGKPGRELSAGIDSWIGEITAKLNSDTQVTSADFDAVFNDYFFSSSSEPFKDLGLLENKVSARLEEQKKQFENSYRQWRKDRLEAGDLKPGITAGENTVTVDLEVPPALENPVRVNVDKARIRMAYTARNESETERPDGTRMKTSFLKRHEKILALPDGADPAGYRMEQSPGRIRIIFARLKGKKTEAAK